MEQTNDSGGTNTILIVILLIIVVGLGVYWLTGRDNSQSAPEDNNPTLEVNVSGDASGTSEAGGPDADVIDTPMGEEGATP